MRFGLQPVYWTMVSLVYDYQAGFKPLLCGILAALLLTLFLKETGPAARKN